MCTRRAVSLMAVLAIAACAQQPAPVSPVPEPQPVRLAPKDRCMQYVQEVREQHFMRFGLQYPYWYGVGQLRQESACRSDAVAFDGGKGLSQFIPATEKYVEGSLGPLDMMNPRDAIRAQAFYMAQLHRQNWDGRLWLTYCFYNSGPGQMKKEYKAAGVTDHEKMRAVCRRKVITLKRGKALDLCDVGYDYPKKVHCYGQHYKAFDDRMPFW